MTDRIKALTVILERDIREDDCEQLIDAIKMLRGVGRVLPHVADPSDAVTQYRVRRDLEKKLFDVLGEDKL